MSKYKYFHTLFQIVNHTYLLPIFKNQNKLAINIMKRYINYYNYYELTDKKITTN